MHAKRCFALWCGFLLLTIGLISPLAAEAQQPVVDVPANATLDYTGHAWECKRGYRRSGKTCRVIDLPANATLDYDGHAWECKQGYRQSGKTCRVVELPANAILDYTGHAWECKQGYRRSGKTCHVVDLPANAVLDYTGHAWECAQGYRQSGKACHAIDLPANAVLDYTGHAWECERGYKRMGDVCEKMTAAPNPAQDAPSAVQASRVHPPQHNHSKGEIQQIQEHLKKAGFDPGPMDGILGSKTIKALHLYLLQDDGCQPTTLKGSKEHG
jgi:uncharacterized protein YceK